MDSFTTQIVTEVAIVPSANHTNTTQIISETIYSSSANRTNTTQIVTETLFNLAKSSIYLTQFTIRVLHDAPLAAIGHLIYVPLDGLQFNSSLCGGIRG